MDNIAFKHLDLGELIDLFCTTVFPISYVVTTKRTFPKVSYWNFIIWFPLFYAILLLVSMAAIESETLYDAGRCMHLLVPSEETAGPTIYSTLWTMTNRRQKKK